MFKELDFIDVAFKENPPINVTALDVSQLDADSWLLDYRSPLSSYRRKHILRFIQFADRQRGLGATLIINHLLSRYGLCEKDMEYAEGIYHKPYFLHHPDIHFNISHSGDYAIVALAGFPIGIDIQKQISFEENVARLCMHRREFEKVCSYDVSLRDQLFTKAWCAKEALLKVSGSGIIDHFFPVLDFSLGEPIILDEKYKSSKLHFSKIGEYMIAVAYCSVKKEC